MGVAGFGVPAERRELLLDRVRVESVREDELWSASAYPDAYGVCDRLIGGMTGCEVLYWGMEGARGTKPAGSPSCWAGTPCELAKLAFGRDGRPRLSLPSIRLGSM